MQQHPKFRDEWLLRDCAAEAPAERVAEWRAQSRPYLSQALVDAGIVAFAELAARVRARYRIDPVPDGVTLDRALLDRVPEALCRRHAVVPVAADAREITVATANPLDEDAHRQIGWAAGLSVRPLYCLPAAVDALLEEMARPDAVAYNLLRRFEVDSGAAAPELLTGCPGAVETVETPVGRLASGILTRAIEAEAAEIRIEHRDTRTSVVRFRVGPDWRDALQVPRYLAAGPLVARLKMMACLDPLNRSTAQKGSVHVRSGEARFRVEVATQPERNGERVVLGIAKESVDDQDRRPPAGEQTQMDSGAGERTTRVLLAFEPGTSTTALTEALAANGYAVDSVADGADALARLAKGEMGALVAGLTLPNLDGERLVRGARSLLGLVDLPIVVCVPPGAGSRLDSLLAAGADDVLPSTAGPEDVVARLTATLERRASWSEPADLSRPRVPASEADRITALRSLQLLDTPPEERFDRITRRVCEELDAPIALITLVDTERQWFKSNQGLQICETSRDVSFCAHAIHRDDVMVVSDALLDPRFASNPLVTGEPWIRFYAGYPLRGPDRHRLGTLCVIDRRPRNLTSEELSSLRELGRLAERELLRDAQPA